MRTGAAMLLGVGALALSGCAAKLAWDVVTLPVEVASKTVDVLTESQDEADLKRGRAARKADEKRGREERRRARERDEEREQDEED